MKKNSKKPWINLIIILCVIVFAVCFGVLYSWYLESKNANDEIRQIKPITITQRNGNKDYVAWLKIDGTNIDYPVMQKDGSPEYYLRKNYKGEYSYSGTPFLDSRCNINSSQNLIIYGHNMRDGAMFACLTKFKNKSYADEHQTVELNVKGTVQKYKLYAVCVVDFDDGWYGYTDQISQDTFNELMAHIQNKSSYTSNEKAEYEDFFITLSTCDYSQDNGRLILFAKKESK